jgi:hypothetical protein
MMNAPQWHLRHIEGDFVQAECTACPFPFRVTKAAAPGAIITDLQRQFDEHCKRVHEILK